MKTLEAVNISKSYSGRTVVNGVSVKVQTGEVVGLLGPNGAGKTTTFYSIVGLVACDKGQILLDQQEITAKPMFQRARLGLGYLPQEASVFRKMTVEENVMSILETVDELSVSQKKNRLEELLEEFGVTHVRKSLASALSGGERRRVEIARALVRSPSFILLDEPFAGIDPIAINDIKTVVHGLKGKGIGVLITDHNVRETLTICDRAYILIDGKVLEEGSPSQIANSELAQQHYLGEGFSL